MTYSDLLETYCKAYKAYWGIRPTYARFTREELREEIATFQRLVKQRGFSY